MSVLPQRRFVASPILAVTTAVSIGIVIQHYAGLRSTRTLAVIIAVTTIGCLLAIVFVRMRRLAAATIAIFAAFVCAGISLALINERPAPATRVASMLESGVINSGDMVEVTGMVQGEPEPAPQSLYLTIRADRIVFNGTDREASGTIVLLARIQNPELV